MQINRFSEALEFHKNGDLEQAVRLYKKIISREPDHFDAWHHLGLAYRSLNKLSKARDCYQKALKLDDKFTPLYNSLSSLLIEQNFIDEAISFLNAALNIDPNNYNTIFLLAQAYTQLNKCSDAIQNYNKLLIIRPNAPEIYNNIGNNYVAIGDITRAVESFGRAIQLQPNFAIAYNNRALCFIRLNKRDEAIIDLEIATKQDPLNPDYWGTLSQLYDEKLEFKSAKLHADQAYSLSSESDVAISAKVISLLSSSNYELAIDMISKKLSKNNDDHVMLNLRAVALKELSKFNEAIIDFERAIQLRPNFYDYQYNLACLKLLLGDFENGFALYETRKLKTVPYGSKNYGAKIWTGIEEINNKNILVYTEQGIGDVIQFSRYLKILEDKGANVFLADSGSNLRVLLDNIGEKVRHTSIDLPEYEFDFYCALMSLPFLISTTLNTIPANVPYLFADKERMSFWSKHIGSEGFKIAIAWQGSKTKIDQDRSVPLLQFKELANIPGIRLISIQKGAGTEQINEATKDFNIEQLGNEFDNSNDAFLDTAAVMKLCDLVITVDTSVAHVAGALGVPVWTALKHVPDWRWLLERSDSPWYPTMRLFRQPKPGDWQSVFMNIKIALTETLEKSTN